MIWNRATFAGIVMYLNYFLIALSIKNTGSLLCRFEEQEAPGSRSFFTEIIASISDIKFSKDGRYILSRDYMTLKVGLLKLILY